MLLVTMLAAGCAAQPRQRPIELGAVNTGPGSLEQVRRQLAGTWQLESLDLHSATGEVRRVKGSGSLTYDEYGNLRVMGKVDEPLEGVEAGLLQYEGRAVIDPVKSELRLLDVTGDAARGGSAADFVAAANVRRYRFEGNLLHISVVNDRGETTATSVWRRATGPGGPAS